ncbi:DUF554 domain-containing protein [Vibrio mangrovi]|uniref:DUF554 domain-containing protein n=1 Tax=Vibrio mangrovi TaxID=474394 RepID=A0A1Y6ITA3_9VIBR|nr:DUF554 domain-containing protein [Vibrio mangrovi]MDW6003903.1 DUF554 domain-containing protein [Vibrio mangrovi]SMR99303.1 putative membrane protein YdfK [Vibrio mangrovi]
MIGPLVNASAIILGSGIGALFGDKVPERLQTRMPVVFGLASMGLGIAMMGKVQLLAAVILALLIGSTLGELIQLEERIKGFAGLLKHGMGKISSPPDSTMHHHDYMDKFISVLILFCVSSTGVFGAINEGVTGDPSLLIVKSFLDLFTATIFAIRLGLPVAMLAIPQCLIQLILYFSANAIMPLTTPEMIADFSAVGGLVMLATGFRICGILTYPVANMIPALILAMPVSALWGYFVL